VTVECLDAGEDFAVVAAGNQDLCARADCGLEDGQGSGGELVLLDLSDLILAAQRLVVRIGLEKLGVAYVNSDLGLERSSLCSVSRCGPDEGKCARTGSLRRPYCRVLCEV
jgi:hypothetical protein